MYHEDGSRVEHILNSRLKPVPRTFTPLRRQTLNLVKVLRRRELIRIPRTVPEQHWTAAHASDDLIRTHSRTGRAAGLRRRCTDGHVFLLI
jgi:hypothetical protein